MKIIDRYKSLSKAKRIQLILSVIFTLFLCTAIPVWSWFRLQRQMARYQRIHSPDTLYITAADCEATINIKLDGIDPNAYWDRENNIQASYKDYVFAVAGEYVTQYTLQMAHTTNNGYTFEIYPAVRVTADETVNDGSKLEGRDYVIYDPITDPETKYPEGLPNALKSGNNDTLYYKVGSSKLNGKYLDPQAETTPGAADHSGKYYNETFKNSGGVYGNVQANAVPLYWQKTGIQVKENGKQPFYHEYILRVRWTDPKRSDTYKDTDIIYLTAAVQ